jgi:hypothetical protein
LIEDEDTKKHEAMILSAFKGIENDDGICKDVFK